IVVVEEPVLDQLVRLRHDLGHVGYVEVTDVRAEERVEPRAQRVRLAIEGPGVDRIVGLAAEVEAFDVEIVEVLLAGDLAAGGVVEGRDAAGGAAVLERTLTASD